MRQQLMIKGLQEELKAAKFVMKNPRLRFRLQEMLNEIPRTPNMSSSMRQSRVGSQDDLPKVSRLDYESPVKTKARTRSTTHSPETSMLKVTLRAPKLSVV